MAQATDRHLAESEREMRPMATPNEHEANGPAGPAVDWRRCDEATLIGGMRNGGEFAYAEFCGRYLPMLKGLARRIGVNSGGRSTLVTEFLDDMALRLGCSSLPAPRSLAAYLAVGFRARLAQEARSEMRRQGRLDALAAEIGSGGERAVAESVSAYSIECTVGPDADSRNTEEAETVARVGARCRLVTTLLDAASESERKMLALMAQRMPQREIAELLELTAGATRVRILRLRERLWREAVAYANTLPVDEGLVLQRMLARRLTPPAPRKTRSGSSHTRADDEEGTP